MGTVPVTLAPPPPGRRTGGVPVAVAWALAAALPLIGLVSLLVQAKLDPNWSNHKVHFVLFLSVGGVDFVLASAAGEAAERRGDARVLLMSLAFLATGGFLALHAVGTPGILFAADHAGFKVAIPVGLLLAALFGGASAFVDVRPGFAPLVMRRRRLLRGAVVVAMAVWLAWTLAELPPLSRPSSEGGSGSLLGGMAAVGTIVHAVAACRYWVVYRGRMGLLPASIIACFVLLAEAMIGVAVTGERSWHASWWEWHCLIVTGYLVIGFAAHHEWHDERFRDLYLATTRERPQDVSVLSSNLAGFTTFSERSTPGEVATVLHAYYEVAAPLVSRRFGGEVPWTPPCCWSCRAGRAPGRRARGPAPERPSAAGRRRSPSGRRGATAGTSAGPSRACGRHPSRRPTPPGRDAGSGAARRSGSRRRRRARRAGAAGSGRDRRPPRRTR